MNQYSLENTQADKNLKYPSHKEERTKQKTYFPLDAHRKTTGGPTAGYSRVSPQTIIELKQWKALALCCFHECVTSQLVL